jgi:uroporphyrinogen-III synthase
MMRVLVTRPREDAEALAVRLGLLGFEAVIEPMIEVRFADGAAIDSEGAQAVVFTSANGVRALKNARGGSTLSRMLPVFAVGAATAAAARAAGFRDVIEGQGSVEELARTIVARCPPSAGSVIHICGSIVARDLAALLAPSGIRLIRAVLYESIQATQLQPETRALLASGKIAAALFFSPRTAQAFVNLVNKAGLAASMGSVTALALSPAVAEVLRLPFARVTAAARPTADALLEALAEVGRSSNPKLS